MTAPTRQGADRLGEISDHDVETVIRGGIPVDTSLVPLRAIVAELRSLAHWATSEDFIEFHAGEAAELCAARHVPTSQTPGNARRVVDSVRRRTATAAATLAMFASATGVAVASDGAVPGDWNYGIDRAVELIGIGAGGEHERLQELQVLEGPDVAVAVSSERSAWVTQLIDYFAHADSVDGSTVSEIAKQGAGKPEDPGEAGKANKPEDPGAAGKANKPEDPGEAGKANKPEDPGAAGSGGQPEDPGAAGSSGQAEDAAGVGGTDTPEDPGAMEGSGQAEGSGGADDLKKAPVSTDPPGRSNGADSKP